MGTLLYSHFFHQAPFSHRNGNSNSKNRRSYDDDRRTSSESYQFHRGGDRNYFFDPGTTTCSDNFWDRYRHGDRRGSLIQRRNWWNPSQKPNSSSIANDRILDRSAPREVLHREGLLLFRPTNHLTKNLQASFILGNVEFCFFHSFHNHTFCLSIEGKNNKVIWFDSDLLSWILECLFRICFEPSWVFTKHIGKRDIRVAVEHFDNENFVVISESRIEGSRSISVPVGKNFQLLRVFTLNLQQFYRGALKKSGLCSSNEHGCKVVERFCSVDVSSVSGIGGGDWLPPLVQSIHQEVSASYSFLSWENESIRKPKAVDRDLALLCTAPSLDLEEHSCSKCLFAMDTESLSEFGIHALKSAIPAPSLDQSLTPSVLNEHWEGAEAGMGMMKLNALEDASPGFEEPALYTHSEGEKTVFIDSKLEPFRIITPSSSNMSLQLPKLAKGKATYSPSHMVTRSRAKIIAAGRKEHPIKGVDTSDEESESFVEGIRSAFKRSCPSIKTKNIQTFTPTSESQVKLSKKQKKKAKMKLK
ncbi:unnamed protein product [Cuscuta campestris]|uniref:Uncharacterized protein n=1 Tax=Cuscuta campestris TaxID=132261 RepID=A0A484MX79_9ASTE|nr:unnamed protein product [Cuscuta campestris]